MRLASSLWMNFVRALPFLAYVLRIDFSTSDMVGDGDRGAILEMLLTKLVHCGQKIQIVGMSATTVYQFELACSFSQ